MHDAMHCASRAAHLARSSASALRMGWTPPTQRRGFAGTSTPSPGACSMMGVGRGQQVSSGWYWLSSLTPRRGRAGAHRVDELADHAVRHASLELAPCVEGNTGRRGLAQPGQVRHAGRRRDGADHHAGRVLAGMELVRIDAQGVPGCPVTCGDMDVEVMCCSGGWREACTARPPSSGGIETRQRTCRGSVRPTTGDTRQQREPEQRLARSRHAALGCAAVEGVAQGGGRLVLVCAWERLQQCVSVFVVCVRSVCVRPHATHTK